MSLGDRGGHNLLGGIFWCRGRDSGCQTIHYTIKERIMVSRVLGAARAAVDGQAECLEDQILAHVFGLEGGVTTEEWSSVVLYYDHTHE